MEHEQQIFTEQHKSIFQDCIDKITEKLDGVYAPFDESRPFSGDRMVDNENLLEQKRHLFLLILKISLSDRSNMDNLATIIERFYGDNQGVKALFSDIKKLVNADRYEHYFISCILDPRFATLPKGKSQEAYQVDMRSHMAAEFKKSFLEWYKTKTEFKAVRVPYMNQLLSRCSDILPAPSAPDAKGEHGSKASLK